MCGEFAIALGRIEWIGTKSSSGALSKESHCSWPVFNRRAIQFLRTDIGAREGVL
jgi:hypothetical protein